MNDPARSGDHFTGQTRPQGIDAELAATSTGHLLVASWANGSWMYRNTGKKSWASALSLGDGGAGFSNLTFVTPTSAWVVYGPVTAFPANFGRLYHLADAGRRRALITLNPSH